MTARHRRRPVHLAPGLLALAIAGSLHAQESAHDLVTQSDWGGAGLLQTPTARMEAEGQFSLSASYTAPYARYNLSMQPLPWLEGTFRYININTVRYGVPSLSGDQHYKDKSIDLKLRLWQESRYLPEVALGFRDLGGTGLFSSEYLVASKRFGTIDASLGLATGYMGNRGDFANPLRLIDDRFETRPGLGTPGDVGAESIFRGPIGIFGGITWQTPLDQLLLKVEFDGNDYKNEARPRATPIEIEQSSPINVGLVYRPSPNLQLTAGLERGNTAVIGLTLTTNLATTRSNAPIMDRPALPLRRHSDPDSSAPAVAVTSALSPNEATGAAPDWAGIAADLNQEAGIRVSRITRRDHEVIIHGSHNRYFYPAQGIGRGARVLDNALGDDVTWFTFAHERAGTPIAETSVERQAFADYVDRRIDLPAFARKVELAPPAQQRREEVYEAPFRRLRGSIAPGYKQILGGPDGFILYQLSADFSGSYWFSRNTWLSGMVSVDIANNFDKFRYDAPTRLPRVRTWQRQYMTTSDVTVPNLQLTTVHQLGRDWYGMAYAGYLESMYGGVGGEVLYRPFGEQWAIGADINQVRQRDFDQHAGFRDYEITTGHITGYYTFGRTRRLQANVSVGKYLAGDIGTTVNLTRRFNNGVTMGAYATKTNISSRTFGEGSFDKGIYFSIPMDFVLPRPSRARAEIMWQPLFRDGGAKLFRTYGLYPMTGERSGELLFDNLEWIDR
ncbi:YjbH domain-containing protein [Luteimonas sp. RC10]|uniref:YjbH domain-containing protein n=1 Tax=Luteimonas sp. RC10 TaxID=2587035 RepID=UPI001616FA80|nr:YjbH domain-containing protein [Luteimonas sp. RC10]MBB3344857.1 hypothetical protein [Luteimonas sp. RC10]